MRLQEGQKLVELKVILLGPEASLQLGVQVHDPSVVSILQAVRLNVLPKSGDDARPCIFLNSQDRLQSLAEHKPLRRVFGGQRKRDRKALLFLLLTL
jgi:hypothetical protein